MVFVVWSDSVSAHKKLLNLNHNEQTYDHPSLLLKQFCVL